MDWAENSLHFNTIEDLMSTLKVRLQKLKREHQNDERRY